MGRECARESWIDRQYRGKPAPTLTTQTVEALNDKGDSLELEHGHDSHPFSTRIPRVICIPATVETRLRSGLRVNISLHDIHADGRPKDVSVRNGLCLLYFISHSSLATRISLESNSINGYVTDMNRAALPGVYVSLKTQQPKYLWIPDYCRWKWATS